MANSNRKASEQGTKDDDSQSALFTGSPEERVQAWLKFTLTEDGHLKAGDWMGPLIPHIKFVSTSTAGPHPGVVFSYIVQPSHCNRMRNLHGGCIASIFDFCTTMPLTLIGRPGHWEYMGVSRTLNVTYLRPASAGEELLIECELVHAGKKMATLKGVMRRKSDGLITATCEHGKYNVDPESKL